MAILISDVECYPNYFLLLMRDLLTGQLYRWERFNDEDMGPYSRQDLKKMLTTNTIVGFNWLGYDEHVVNGFVNGYSNERMHEIGNFIILGYKNEEHRGYMFDTGGVVDKKMARYRVYDEGIFDDMDRVQYDAIDLMPIAPLMASLKIYAGRIGHPSLQDLPIEPGTIITKPMRDELIPYCANDLGSTEALFIELLPQIQLRKKMSKKYELNLLSKSDAQIAEGVIRKELFKVGVNAKPKKNVNPKGEYKYDAPEWVHFQSAEFNEAFNRVLGATYIVTAAGKFMMDPILKKPIEYKGSAYKMGVGGLHSQESSRSIFTRPGEKLFDIDVESFYPRIILNNKYGPKDFVDSFLEVYDQIVTDRIEGKRAKDEVVADSLKIVINSSFGKFGNKYSALFSPKLMMQTTLTGQLALMMLIEQMEMANISVVSANTDGIVVHTKSDLDEDAFRTVWSNWEKQTSFKLEETQYESLHSESVNSYFAVKSDKSKSVYKTKGNYGEQSLSKTPGGDIASIAVMEYCTYGIPLEDTIYECDDILKFTYLRKVGGGAMWRDEKVGATCRWYTGKDGSKCGGLTYFKTGNAVPYSGNAILINKLPRGGIPDDLDRQAYVDKAKGMLNAIGL